MSDGSAINSEGGELGEGLVVNEGIIPGQEGQPVEGQIDQQAAEPQFNPEQIAMENRLNILTEKDEYYRSLANMSSQPQQPNFFGQQAPQQPYTQQPVNSLQQDNPYDQDLNQLLDAKLQPVIDRLEQANFQARVDSSLKAARASHTDFDAVVALAEQVVASAPDANLLLDMAKNHKDPAEFVYRLGTTHPDYINMVRQQATSKIVNQMNTNLSRANTLSNVSAGSSNAISAAERMKQMSDSEFADLHDKVLRGEY